MAYLKLKISPLVDLYYFLKVWVFSLLSYFLQIQLGKRIT
jgi:hypothetical protein